MTVSVDRVEIETVRISEEAAALNRRIQTYKDCGWTVIDIKPIENSAVYSRWLFTIHKRKI